jgi:hypothetical protein
MCFAKVISINNQLKYIVNGYSRPDHEPEHCYHQAPDSKPEAATAVVVAPDNRHEDARNMLSCI